MSYLEIYNENIRDLLSPSSGYLELRDESKGKNIQVGETSLIFMLLIAVYEGFRFVRNSNKEC